MTDGSKKPMSKRVTGAVNIYDLDGDGRDMIWEGVGEKYIIQRWVIKVFNSREESWNFLCPSKDPILIRFHPIVILFKYQF